jgi:hypothetical protein
MSWRSLLPSAIRGGIVLSVALSGITFSVHDAEARRGGRFHSSKHVTKEHKDHSSDHDAAKRKSDEEHDGQGADSSGGTYVPGIRVRSREAARGAETASDADDPTAPKALPRPRVLTVKPIEDLDVAGCPTGMICTVCLAGCDGDIGGIVGAQNKTPIPRPRH